MDRISEIRERLDAATPGPWSWVGKFLESRDVTILADGTDAEWENETIRTEDASLIAHAPDDLAYLLDRLERAEWALEASCHADFRTCKGDFCACPEARAYFEEFALGGEG